MYFQILVMEAANFANNAFVPSLNEELIGMGLEIGSTAKVIRRFTVDFGNRMRKDVNKGELVIVKGMANGHPVIAVEKVINGKPTSKDYSVNPRCIKLTDEHGKVLKDEKKDPEKATGPTFDGPRIAYLAKDGGKVVKVWKWEPLLHAADKDTRWKNASGQLMFCMQVLAKKLPTYSSKDLSVITRDEKVEVWTHRPFAKNELTFAPESTELKDRLWSHHGKAVLCKGGEAVHPEGKHIVIEGIRRCAPSDVRPFSLFFAVERKMLTAGATDDVADKEKKECNMQLAYVDMTLKVHGDLPFAPKRVFDEAIGGESLPKLPIMFNPLPIEKGVRLICQEDVALKKVGAALVAQQVADAKKAAESSKRKKTE